MLLVQILGLAILGPAVAQADNKRLNDSVVANVYTLQQQAGCTNDVTVSSQLQLAAEWHSRDLLNNRSLDGDIGTDGSTPQSRADAAGFRGRVAETVAIHPALAISGIELINQWYYNPVYFEIMSDCANSKMGVWSENSLDRTVVVAVYGQPEQSAAADEPDVGLTMPERRGQRENLPVGPTPDYDASDEIEFGISWLPWILRGVYPPPGYPPQ
ncbi:CAP domain-containing protein [Mycobacterium sp. 1274756.6]|uniref:CAP domain-containing protein n=1 Tax=Mycobacterium sp. 1274756.6 TaxID=1834076 RepID=UPI001E57C08B|nr:CAP domain-containing protein [Mycobacterium sp. 1274756.6]